MRRDVGDDSAISNYCFIERTAQMSIERQLKPNVRVRPG